LRKHPECYLELQDLAARAERARAWFARHAPEWCQPLPLLLYDEHETILCGGDWPRHLVMYYAGSLQQRKFDYLEHPPFYDYARGVLADPECPSHLRGDPELLAEFPPKPLPGLVDGVCWRPMTTVRSHVSSRAAAPEKAGARLDG
jgi:hypothetical protein